MERARLSDSTSETASQQLRGVCRSSETAKHPLMNIGDELVTGDGQEEHQGEDSSPGAPKAPIAEMGQRRCSRYTKEV